MRLGMIKGKSDIGFQVFSLVQYMLFQLVYIGRERTTSRVIKV